jgi:hypothetical protein
MITKIFLDLDGVIRDWVRGVIKWYDLDCMAQDVLTWSWFEKYVEHLMTPKEFWEGQTSTFWETLPFTQEAPMILDVMNYIQKSGNTSVFLLTSPTLSSAGATQSWIRKNMPKYFSDKRYIIGPPKYACASKNSILIDDAEHNVFPFAEWGGYGFLYPRPWNCKRDSEREGVERLIDYLIVMGVM